MWITVDCFFKFLMCSCRACIAGTETVGASSGHLTWLFLLKAMAILSPFEDGPSTILSGPLSFSHHLAISLGLLPWLQKPSFLFLQPAGLALAHFGRHRPGWWRQRPDMLWTWEAIPGNASALYPLLSRIWTDGGCCGQRVELWWNPHPSVVTDILKMLNIWHRVVCLSCQILEDGKSRHRLSGDMHWHPWKHLVNILMGVANH